MQNSIYPKSHELILFSFGLSLAVRTWECGPVVSGVTWATWLMWWTGKGGPGDSDRRTVTLWC